MSRTKILLADDQDRVRRLVAATLGSAQWQLLYASDGEEALRLAREAQPAIVLLDVTMPKVDGFEVCRRLKSDPATAHMAVVMLTGLRDEESRVRASLAGADEYFVKPFSPLALVTRLQELLDAAQPPPAAAAVPPANGSAPAAPPAAVPFVAPLPPPTPSVVSTLSRTLGTSNTTTITAPEAQQMLAYARDLNQSIEHVRGLYAALERSYLATAKALAAAIDARDPYTGGHVERVADFAVILGRGLGWADQQLTYLEMGAALHDVGKIGVPDAVLRKPGRLTDEEWELMRQHPDIGARLLQHVPFLQPSLGCVLRHHERYDGAGYPGCLLGEDIPMEARIVAVADTFDAMITDRPYRRALSYEHARREILHGRGTQFDPTVVDVFDGVYTRLVVAHSSRTAGDGAAAG
jgi:putative two-component system response regulator